MLFLAKPPFCLFMPVLTEINSGKSMMELFMEKKEFEKKPEAGPPGL
jgi:hypothetical protein